MMSITKSPRSLGALLLTALGLSCAVAGVCALRTSTGAPAARVSETYHRLPLSFEPNVGQAPEGVRYVSRGRGYGLYIGPSQAALALSRPAEKGARASSAPSWTLLRMDLVGANPKAGMRAAEQLPGASNYFIGKDASAWRTNVPNFARVAGDDVYPGVDVVYYGNQQRLEYDFIVAPGTDPSQIRMRFDGADAVRVSSGGELLLETPAGVVTQQKPVVYQEVGGRRKAVAGDYVMLASNEVGFQVGGYDRTRTLVIDPVLDYSTYLGGDSRDDATDVAVDADGNAYITGFTASTANFPGLNTFSPQQALAGGFDAFVTKINAAGNAFVYSTYFGGTGDENVYTDNTDPANPVEIIAGGLALDDRREVYVTGYTTSVDFPLAQPIQINNAGNGDAFLFKLNANGDAIAYSTYLGGRGLDAGHAVAVHRVDDPAAPGDADQAEYYAAVTGETNSSDYPVVNPLFGVYRGGIRDAFVSRLNASGTGFVTSTYLGGTGEDRGYGIAVHPNGNLFVTGITLSFDDPNTKFNEGFPSTNGVFQPRNEGSSDAFVAKFNLQGNGLDYGTYLGGSGENAGTGIAVDNAGNAYVGGFTTATDFPTTAGAFDETWNGGESDAFVVKVNPTASALVYSTYLGGDGRDVATRLAISRPGVDPVLVYVTGLTASTDYPVRAALRTSLFGGVDAFVTKLLATGADVEYSTYLGGAQDDHGTGIGVNASGVAVVAGTTLSNNFPAIRPLDATLNDGVSAASDGFVARLIGPPGAPSTLTGASVDSTTNRLSWTDTSDNETEFEVEARTPGTSFAVIGTVAANTTTFDHTGLTPNSDYIYRVRARNTVGGGPYSNTVQVRTAPTPPPAPSNAAVVAATQTSLRVTWTDNSTTESEFIIQRSTDGTNFTEAGRVRSNVRSFTNTGLRPNTQYFYQVLATNAGGTSAPSNVASGTTHDVPPTAPSSLVATAISASQIDLRWTAGSSNHTGFKVLRSTTNSNFVPITTLPAAARTHSDVGLNPSTRYFYQVVATNSGGDSGPSPTANALTLPAGPAAPSNLTVTALSATQLRLNWKKNSTNNTSFKIERSTDGGNSYTRIATVGPNVLTFTNGGLTPNTTYFYRVAASNAGGDSPFSAEVSGTTLPVPPASPGGIRAAAVSQTEIQITWNDRADSEDGFKIERSTDNGQTFRQVATVLADEEAYTDTGLRAETRYTYRLRAFNGGGDSPYSGTASATTLPNRPPAPLSLKVVVDGPSSFRLSWTDAARNESSYRVERSDDDGVNFSEIANLPPDSNLHTDRGLSPDTTYVYRVRAVNAGGDSFSNTVSATTPPAAPSSLNAAAVSNREIRLIWVNNSSTATAFRVERKEGNAGTFTQIRQVSAPTTDFLDTGLKGETLYVYRVSAVSPAGVSGFSAEARATTLPDPPGSPSALKAQVLSQSEIRLDWTPASGATNHEVERSLDDGSTWTTLVSLGGTAKTHRDTGLTPGTEYVYRVRAANPGGASGYSNTVRATTMPSPPAAPNSLTATPLSTTSIRLDWAAGGTDQDGFRVQRATGTGAFSQVGTTTSTTFTDNNLSANTRYTYQVIAFNPGGASAPSNRADGLTLPSAPSGLRAAANGTDVQLSWSHNGGADGFRIESSQGGSEFRPLAAVPANVRSYTDTGLLPSTSVSYRVRAYNASGDSENSNTATANTGVGLQSITLRKTRIRGGRSTRGTVTLTGPAPAGGVRVNLSSNQTVARVAGSVFIPAGQTSARFRVNTSRPRRTTFVTISASLSGRTLGATLTVRR